MSDLDMAKALFGVNAVHVPAWMYVQNGPAGAVSFVGGSRGSGVHPLRFGSDRTHQLIVGEIVVRPHVVTGTDALRGSGLAGLALGQGHEVALGGDVLVNVGDRLAALRAGA